MILDIFLFIPMYACFSIRVIGNRMKICHKNLRNHWQYLQQTFCEEIANVRFPGPCKHSEIFLSRPDSNFYAIETRILESYFEERSRNSDRVQPWLPSTLQWIGKQKMSRTPSKYSSKILVCEDNEVNEPVSIARTMRLGLNDGSLRLLKCNHYFTNVVRNVSRQCALPEI